jgi:DNA invertase Pin-like site-specific DNA recombinase
VDTQPLQARHRSLERQREGIAKVKAEGRYKGRKPTVAVQVEPYL